MRKITLQLLLFFSISVYAQNFTESLLVPNNTFDYPYDLVYGPDNYLYLTERVGERVQRVNVATGTVDLLLDMSALVWRNGGQDGLLGIILHPQFGQGTGNDYIYLSYTYSTTSTAANRRLRIVRYTFTANGTDGSLSSPLVLLDNLPGSNDHNSAKFAFGPDGKLYYTIGDQGKNQFDNKCLVIRSQDLPTAAMVIANDYSTYEGKILRMNLDGSIPSDNPLLGNVRSHIFTYGHRNAQGIAFSSNGILYSNEHGPKSDDEINIITAAKNYGWPRISGFKDDRAYTYCNWSTATNCNGIAFSDYTCGAGATTQTESSFNATDFQPPLATFYTVDNTFDFSGGYLTWPTIAPSSLKVYEGYSCGIPGWDKSLFSTSLKAGRVFRSKLSADGSTIEGTPQELFASNNRLRSVVIAPNGKEFYIITDSGGSTSGPTGSGATVVNPGVILKYTYIPSDKAVASSASNILENEFQANWSAPCVSPASYKLDVITVATFLGTESSLAEWRATTNTTTATSGSNGNNTKTISVNTGVAITYTTGVAGNAYSTSGWTSVAAKWWQIDLVTTGRYNIRVSSAQQSSNTGPRDFKLQYRIGTSGIWTDVPNATNIQCANNFTSGVLNNIVLPEICNNKAQVFLRWLVTSNTAVNGATVVSGGTNRIDNIVILSSNQSLLANYNDLTVNGINTQVTGLAANTTYYYRVRAVHANEPSLNSGVFTVTTNPPMSSSGSSINVSCNGEDNGTATINVTGGSPPYSYSWSPTGGTNSTATGLAAGNYIVTVTDSKLKTHTRNFTITEPFQTVWNGISWSNGLSVAGIKAVFNANFNITADMAACGVVVNTGATVTLNSNFDLTVDGKVQVATGGLLTVENNANLIQVRDIANSGAIQVKRQASMRRLDYVYWSSPVANQNLLAFSPLTMTNRFYTLNEVTNNFDPINPGTNTFDLAKGYMIRAPNTFPTTPQTFNGLFQGVPNNGNAAIGVTVASSGNNLIGNPYPSTVNAVSFLNDNPGTIYFWTHSQQGATAAANYASFNLSGGTAATAGGPTPNGSIQVGQGFILKKSTAGTATFTNSMRTGNNQNQFFRENIERHRFWLNLSAENQPVNQILIGYIQGASNGIDASYDGTLLEGTNALASVIDGQGLVIQARALPFANTDQVPLRFVAAQSGSYNISIDHFDGVFAEGQAIYVHDAVSGTTHNLSESAYNFITEAGSFDQRFTIVYQAETLGVGTITKGTDVLVKQNQHLQLQAQGFDIAKVEIYDLRGRLLYSKEQVAQARFTATDFQAETQIVLVKIYDAQNEVYVRKFPFKN